MTATSPMPPAASPSSSISAARPRFAETARMGRERESQGERERPTHPHTEAPHGLGSWACAPTPRGAPCCIPSPRGSQNQLHASRAGAAPAAISAAQPCARIRADGLATSTARTPHMMSILRPRATHACMQHAPWPCRLQDAGCSPWCNDGAQPPRSSAFRWRMRLAFQRESARARCAAAISAAWARRSSFREHDPRPSSPGAGPEPRAAGRVPQPHTGSRSGTAPGAQCRTRGSALSRLLLWLEL